MSVVRRLVVLTVGLLLLALPSLAQGADFGFVPGSVSATPFNGDGSIDTQAGSHPDRFVVSFDINTDEATQTPIGGPIRDVLAELPPGLVGNPESVATCSRAEFEGPQPHCSGDSQVGILTANVVGFGQTQSPLYNLAPPPGLPTKFGFSLFQNTLFQEASVDAGREYGLIVAAPNIPVAVTHVTETIWGTPSEQRHDPDRVCGFVGKIINQGCAAGVPRPSYLTLPTSCGELETTIKIDSKERPGQYLTETVPIRGSNGSSLPLVGCEAVPFDPKVTSQPTSSRSSDASGLEFQLDLPNQGLLGSSAISELLGSTAIAETEPVKTVVTLPEGVTVNPSAANGIVGCPQHLYEIADGEPGQGCPEASKVGTLVAKTPLLEEPIEGSIYLAQPHENEFGSLLGLYIVARAKERGVLVKQAGLVEAEQSTGRLTTTFDRLPPLPYSSFEFDLREGARAPLITPQACGQYETVARLYPFSAPDSPVVRTVPFKVSSGAGGAACADSETQLPNKPAFEAGTVVPVAGAYSPFVFRLKREDGTQLFKSIVAEPPAGLVARLAGIPYCPESGIVQAASRSAEGDGALEQASPSCPAASEVGSVTAGAGAGAAPYFTAGKVYLAGPYKGAPISLEVIAPAIAGPFDLGVVANRIAVHVNEETAKIKAESDPLPTILHGIPLDLRSISVELGRSQFTLNPTNCEPSAATGSLTTFTGAVAPLSQQFQVGGCKGLEFAPKLKIKLNGATKRSGHPGLQATITFAHSDEEAHAKSIQVGLPHSLFLDQGNLSKVCKQADLRAGTCPAGSVYGHVKAWTPLFEKPLEGPVYLGVGFGYELPALVTDLNGQVRILSHGRVDTTKQHGLRNTFEFVPDAPISRVVLQMKGGKRYGLIENSDNLCSAPQRADARLVSHSGRVSQLHPTIATSCGGKHRKGRAKSG